MKALDARIPRSIPIGSKLVVCDNSGAKVIKIFAVKNLNTTRRRYPAAKIGDMVNAAVVKGRPDMRKQVVQAIVVRQSKEFRRPDGTRVKFQDNSAVILKDEKGNPKGTMFKGPIAKEATDRWPGIAKIAKIIV